MEAVKIDRGMRFLRALAALFAGALLVPASAGALSLEPVGTFASPTYVTSDPRDPNRLFVVEQDGRIRLVEGGEASSFLDIDSIVRSAGETPGGNEEGLLSMAFSPGFAANARFYVFYTGLAGNVHIAEFIASGNRSSPASRREVVQIPHPGRSNHNGGQLQFGPDQYLYASVGDGGGGGDPNGNAQSLGTLLGKVLRIDPAQSGARRYTVPADNPFVGLPGADEIWSYGLRNPWRFSFDRVTGALTIGDVGQGSWEEINYEPGSEGRGSGDNFGWDCREGAHDFTASPSPECPDLAGTFTEPVFEYANGGSTCAVTGGYVVRDPGLDDLYGRYLYADYCAGELRSLDLGLPLADDDRSEGLSVSQLASFGEDACGRVYVVSRQGPVHRLVDGSPSVCPPPPARGPGQGPVTDVTSPSLELEARRRQRVRRSRTIRVRARADEPADVVLKTKVRRRGRGSFGLDEEVAQLAAGVTERLRWKLTRREVRKVRRHLREGKKALARVRGQATDAAGNASERRSVRIRLAR